MTSSHRSESDTNRVLDWNTLDPDEQRVLDSGIDREYLVFAYARWIPEPDVHFPNRAYRYIPALMEAGKRLVEKGWLGIVAAKEPGPPRELTREEAIKVVEDVNNWWRYDPQFTDEDPEDNGVNPVADGLPPVRMPDQGDYLLTDSDRGATRIVNWGPPPLLDPR